MAGIALPDPSGLDFQVWAHLFAEQLADLGVGEPMTEAAWLTWAQELLVYPRLAFLPEPSGFADWRDWARRVVETTF